MIFDIVTLMDAVTAITMVTAPGSNCNCITSYAFIRDVHRDMHKDLSSAIF